MDTNQRPFVAGKGSLTGDRSENQDRSLFLAGPETILLSVADGLGGHPRGEVAAQLLMDVSETMFRQADTPLADPENFMLQCIGKAHQAILSFGRRQRPPIAPRTTAVLAIVQNGKAYWAHVGDSRLYLIRDGRVLVQTRDHSQVRYIRQSEREVPIARTTLTRCLGGLVQPPTTTCGPATELVAGDTLLLCTDGLWGQIHQQDLITGIVDKDEPFDTQIRTLIELAADTPNSDNVTAVALRWSGRSATTLIGTDSQAD